MLAAMPDRRINGMPATNAKAAATNPPATAAGKVGHCAALMMSGRPGKNMPFEAGRMVSNAET